MYVAFISYASFAFPLDALTADESISFTDNSPWTQVAILGFVTFCSVGMFSAVSGLGAGYVSVLKRGSLGELEQKDLAWLKIESLTCSMPCPAVPKTRLCLIPPTESSTAASLSPVSLPVPST